MKAGRAEITKRLTNSLTALAQKKDEEISFKSQLCLFKAGA